MVTFTLNGSSRTFDGDPDMPLLWYLRDELGLTGTKFGCGGGFCGACTVHVDGTGRALVPDADERARRTQGRHASKASAPARAIRCSARGSRPTSRSAATARPARSCRPRRSSPRSRSPTDAADRRGDGRQHLPLRHVSAHSRGHQAARRRDGHDRLRRPLADHRHRQRQPPAFPRRHVLGGRLRRRRPLRAGLAVRAGASASARAADNAALHPSVYLGIDPDGTVHIVTHRSEMGTGIRTSLPMVAADELDADWARVKIVQGIGDARYGDQNTDGSKSIRDFFDAFRQAGASARAMLDPGRGGAVERAGRRVRDRPARGRPQGERTPGAVRLARAPRPPSCRCRRPRRCTLKPRSAWRYIGKDRALYDLARHRRAARPSSAWTPRSTAWSTRRSSGRRSSARR